MMSLLDLTLKWASLELVWFIYEKELIPLSKGRYSFAQDYAKPSSSLSRKASE